MIEKEKTRDYKQWELISVLVVALFGITLIGITAASITVISQSSTVSSQVDSSKVTITIRIKPFNETEMEFENIKEEIKLKITELEFNKVCGTVPIFQFKSFLKVLNSTKVKVLPLAVRNIENRFDFVVVVEFSIRAIGVTEMEMQGAVEEIMKAGFTSFMFDPESLKIYIEDR